MENNEKPNCVVAGPHGLGPFWLIKWVNSFIIIAVSPNLAHQPGSNPEVGQ